MSVITLTFGDAAENHVGMQQLGNKADKGFDYEDLMGFAEFYKSKGKKVEIVNLKCDDKFDDAWFMVVRNGFDKDLELFEELKTLNWDTKALMRGKVVNKHARYNLCFDNYEQEPDYAAGKGRIVNMGTIKLLKELNDEIAGLEGIGDLKIEGNYYYDVNKTFILPHGDVERRKVVGVRLGETLPLFFQWYHKGEPVSGLGKYMINSGDIYFMSEKTVGTDWRKSSLYTLRHSAGNEEVINKNKSK
jgi:hypothetical protein